MRTYRIVFLVGSRVVHTTKGHAYNKREMMAIAGKMSIPSTESITDIRVYPIKNKGDK